MSLKEYELEDKDFSINVKGCDDHLITLEANDYGVYYVEISVNDVIEFAKYFNLTGDDLK